MSSRLRRTMLLLGTTILVIQTAFMPIGILSAETTMDTDEHEPVELPSIQNSLEELTSDSNFFFPQPQIQGRIEEPLKVTFYSDQDVLEAQVLLPKEATIIKEQLSEGTSIVQGDQPQEWLVQSELAQNTFDLPLIFDTAGNYELQIGIDKIKIEIIEEDEAIIEEIIVENEGMDVSKVANEDVSMAENEENYTTVEDSSQLLSALSSEEIKNIKLSNSITLSQLATIRYNKILDLNGYQLTLNGSSELRFAGNAINEFVIRNGSINGTATTFIGDGNNNNPTAATNQLSS